MFFPVNASVKYYTCICGKEECKEISKQFRRIGDVRGYYKLIPNLTKTTRKQNQAKFSSAWRRRMCHHMKLPIDTLNEMSYNNSDENVAVSDRTRTQNQPFKKDAYIAVWHFPLSSRTTKDICTYRAWHQKPY